MIHVVRLLWIMFLGLFVKIPLGITAIIVVPIAVLFTLKDTRVSIKGIANQRLPDFLKWYDNNDPFDIHYGLNGDAPHQERYWERVNGYYTPFNQLPLNPSLYHIYMIRVRWLLRNPINWFQINVLGYLVKEIVFRKTRGYVDYGDDLEYVGDYTSGGFRYTEVRNSDGKVAYEYYLVYPYYKKFPRRCFRFYFGWNLSRHQLDTRRSAQFAFSIHPWHGYVGENQENNDE